MVITLFVSPIIIFFNINIIKKLFSILIINVFVIGVYIFGNIEINKNKEILNLADNKIFVKVVSPNFDLRYDLSLDEIEKRLMKLIRYSDPNKDEKTLFIWPEGVFSGYSYNEILIFKELISKKFF